MIPLLGWPLLVVLAALTLAVMTAALLVWPRLRGPAPLRVVQRLALLVLCQVGALTLVAASANNYAYFYGSWSELLGTQGGPGVVLADGRPSHGVTAAHGNAPIQVSREQLGGIDSTATGWSKPTEWSTRGRVLAMQVNGPRSALSNPVLVYLPPQYFQPAFQKAAFPATVVMTGYPGNTLNLVKRMRFPDVLLNEIQGHRARPMVLVMMRPTVAPPRDTECTDVPAGPQALTYLTQDVPRVIAQTLRVHPTGWGVMGDSTGGYCAVKMVLTHSDTFTAAVSLSGYFHALQDRTTGDLWGGSSVLRNLNSPIWLLGHQPQPPVSLRLTIGSAEQGTSSVQETRRLLGLARPPLTAQVIVATGGHNFANWGAQMPGALDWLSSKLAHP